MTNAHIWTCIILGFLLLESLIVTWGSVARARAASHAAIEAAVRQRLDKTTAALTERLGELRSRAAVGAGEALVSAASIRESEGKK